MTSGHCRLRALPGRPDPPSTGNLITTTGWWGDDPVHHPQQSVLKPQAGQRQTACILYISAPQRSQRVFSISRSTEIFNEVIGRGGGLSGPKSDMGRNY